MPSNNSVTNYKPYLVILIAMVLLQKFTKLAHYYGAEHKVANDYDKNGCVSIDTSMGESCVNVNCETNLFVGLMIISILLFPLVSSFCFIFGWGINYEIMRNKENKVAKLINRTGNFLQRYVVTKEPSREQLEVAVMAFNELE